MSKRALTKYLQSLDKEELEQQVLELYSKFKSVRDYYGFVFNPKEEKRLDEARFRISKEYFPTNNRKPKARRSVAQKLIKHFLTLEMDPTLLSDLMLFNIEIMIRYNERKPSKQDTFYKSVLKSFEEVIVYSNNNGLKAIHKARFNAIIQEVEDKDWLNAEGFDRVLHES